MPLTSLFKFRKLEQLPYRRDPSVDPIGEYASDQLDPSLKMHWAGNPETTERPFVAVSNSRPQHAFPIAKPTAPSRQTTCGALQTIRERQLQETD